MCLDFSGLLAEQSLKPGGGPGDCGAKGSEPQPERGQNPVERIFDGNIAAVSDDSCENAADLILLERTFNLCLIITYHIKALICDFENPVQNKDSLAAAVKNHIAFSKAVSMGAADQCLIPAGNEQRKHAASLGFYLNGMPFPEKLFQIIEITGASGRQRGFF